MHFEWERPVGRMGSWSPAGRVPHRGHLGEDAAKRQYQKIFFASFVRFPAEEMEIFKTLGN